MKILSTLKNKTRNFFSSIHNVIRWIPTLWKDKDWDYCFMLEIERKKLKNMIEWYEKNDMGCSIDGWHTYRTMKWAYDCLCILLDQDWWTINNDDSINNWLSMSPEEHDATYVVRPYVNLRTYKRFLPYLTDKKVNRQPKLWAIELREEKARYLYNKIREQYMGTWWD